MKQELIKETIAGLKDFQLKTVDYVFDQLYVKGKNRMLIADEVGLGKTIVAKGIIAKAYGRYLKAGGPSAQNPTFNIVYICSNMALAAQNIKKLNFLKDTKYVDDTINRLIYLAYQPKENPPSIQIQALTPGTSFDQKSLLGEVNERAIIFCLLAEYSPFYKRWNGLKWLLKGGIKNISTWNNKIGEFWTIRFDKIRKDLYGKFRQELFSFKVTPDSMPKLSRHIGLNRDISLWHALTEVCTELNHANQHRYDFKGEIIRTLRGILSKLCLQYLGADVFILDEFQRYSNLIKLNEDAESPAIEIARAVFNLPEAKVLMLSATPFKPYTNDFDELHGEVHYSEFKSVLQFLMGVKSENLMDEKSKKFWKDYETDRAALFQLLRHPERLESDMPTALALKDKLEKLYRTNVVRTEKLLASNDKNALIKSVDKHISIQAEDIDDFIVLDQITQFINEEYGASLAIPMEYVKSCPFPLSFLDNYQHKEKIRSLITKDPRLEQLVKKTKHGWVNLKDIHNYKPLIPQNSKLLPNAKLRLLLEETIHNNGWKYLWIPPSIPYYESGGAFTDSWGFSKTLIFSSWKLVPKMVAALVSYEAERLSIGDPGSASAREKKENENYRSYYFEKKGRTPRPQFTFKILKDEQEPQQMNNFILTYPCIFLAKFYDPAINVQERKPVQQIKTEIKNSLINLFNELDLNQYVSGEGDWQKWYWLAPLFFDKASKDNFMTSEWFSKGIPPSELSIDSEMQGSDKNESKGKRMHFDMAVSAFIAKDPFPAAKLDPEQLEIICDHMAELALASPAVCFLRNQLRYYDLSTELLDGAFNVASAFLTMFNKPESIAIVRLHTNDNYYWKQVLDYLVDGNVQAMLDEFVYLLINCEIIQSASELSNHISDILSVRTSTTVIEDYPTFIENINKENSRKKSIRSHYAMDFGTQKINTASGTNRQINIRQAFNSPFRPFVLASTSVGQEGLDFHLYCKKIFHWNLPSNPIDFEQREGRIHRYQGLVIRLNLASKYKEQIFYTRDKNNVWTNLFKEAEKEKKQAKFPCDLVPFWHTETESDIKIERFVPLYPYSKDIEKFNNMIKILAFYRLTFGQPRQEELVEALDDTELSEKVSKHLDDLMINLSPICFVK